MTKPPTTDNELETILQLFKRDIERNYGGRTIGKTLNGYEAKERIMQLIARSNQSFAQQIADKNREIKLAVLEARIDETEHSAVQRSIDSGFGVSEYEAFMTVDAKKRRAELTQTRDAMVKEKKLS